MAENELCRGVVITNSFLRTDKFVEHYEWLQEAAKRRHVTLDLWENAWLLLTYGNCEEVLMNGWENRLKDYSFIIFWDKDIRLGNRLQDFCHSHNIPIFNTPRSIAACDDKSETYRVLQNSRMCFDNGKGEAFPLIPTIVAPMTYTGIDYGETEFAEHVIQRLSLPLVVKECFGSFGQQVYLAHDRDEVLSYTRKLAGRPFMYQKYIVKSHGVDVRLQVVGDKVVAAMKRRSGQGDFRANLSNGGTMEAYTPSTPECTIAIAATKALGLSFAGVDLLFADGEEAPAAMLCEVNSNAHFRNIADCTGVNTADCIMEYILEQLAESC
ncbi:MAG: RimK family alpha-L-glutamate ligase [Lachnospiraceae bacterium]|nr:RimK family alpha-L-glutamate ligase [Lachnospiraceae bacterium]